MNELMINLLVAVVICLVLIKQYIKIARRELPETWLHAFGPTKRSLPYIWRLINSFDSITNSFHVFGSKGGMDVWNRYIKKFSELKYYGSITKWLK